jgi:hypothetical protein
MHASGGIDPRLLLLHAACAKLEWGASRRKVIKLLHEKRQ